MGNRIVIALCAVGLMTAAGVPGSRARVAAAAPAAFLPGPTNPPPPVPLQPVDNETLFDPAPTLVVESGIPFGLYHFQVTEMGSIAAEGYSLYPRWNLAAGGRLLQAGHSYQWTCRVRDANGWSEWFSPRWNFSISYRLAPPEPKLPEDGSVVPTSRPILMVKPIPYPVTYCFRVWDGRTLVCEAQSDLPWWQDRGGSLGPGSLYTWSCRIRTASDSSAWFKPFWRFEVACPPAQPATTGRETGCDHPELARPFPNPFLNRVEIRMPALSSSARATVFSADGRPVRSWLVFDSRNSTFVWDGTDDNGSVTSAGSYLCRITIANQHLTVPLMKSGQ